MILAPECVTSRLSKLGVISMVSTVPEFDSTESVYERTVANLLFWEFPWNTSASGALNKWLKANVSKEIVVHSLRHAMRDRLRAVECPANIIDQIGGWSRKGVGESYGNGYQVEQLHRWMAICY